ncbi:hypothetical protein [Chryseobacterium gambrini]|uniref:Uncharacterized protein n=1 Tax=Chryseobacterium gambrini TaxID=373672 RepID=A0A1N7KC68_9FLAO|nr:hypothetical protein [Chryseobacterium gambrini]SIS59208.1 hypothetical protein SAMN05421785_101394 [Chryseobacterium gambrini]
MKCILSIALLGLLVWSCQKKENSTTSDSGYDSATITDSSVNATTTMSNDSIPLANSTTVRSAGKEADSTKTAK